VIFLCTVSPRFPENYHIGVKSGVWGVEEKYQKKIRATNPGDLLFFSIGGRIRSLHRIESHVFEDDTELWPPKDGSLYPFRIKISTPIAVGDVPLETISGRISFMKGKRWQGTIQGGNGVFNPRLTDRDCQLIRSLLKVPETRPSLRKAKRTPTPQIPIQFFEHQIEAAVQELLDDLGCDRMEPLQVRERKPPSHGHFTLLARDRQSEEMVVIVLDGGAGNSSVLLHTLRNMSAIRQRLEPKGGVRGVILTGRLSVDLLLATREIPNLTVREYKLRLELGPEPELDRHRSLGAA
jgi:hypothetical protein